MEVTVPEFSFPKVYEDNNITLMVRDPNCLFAYWELSSEQRDLIASGFGCNWGELSLVVRLYDLTGLTMDRDNPHSFTDLQVAALADNYYIKEVSANRSYCIDLGIYSPDGRFTTLVRSDMVQTPRDTMADGSGRVRVDMLDRLARDQAAAGLEVETFSSDSVYQYYGNQNGQTPAKGED